MKVKFITTTSDTAHPGHQELLRSLTHFGYDAVVIEHPWRGFGDKVLQTYAYLKAHPHVEHFLYSDAWDTFALAPMEEVISKITNWDCILFSAEKACYPHGEKAELYPSCDTPWKYLNGGNWLGSSKRFIDMVERQMPDVTVNDQVYFTDMFLHFNEEGFIQLNYPCHIFQTTGFEGEGDFTLEGGRVINNITGYKPVFCHGNGRTPMEKFYELLK